MNDLQTLTTLRANIDHIDAQILALLIQRARTASQVGEVKAKHTCTPVYTRHEREVQILTKITELALQQHSPISANDLHNIYREIIGSCRALESPMRVAYLGPAGTYSEMAAKKYFSQSENINFIAQRTIAHIFAEVESHRVSYGIVPIENSYEGYVSHSTDGLIAMNKSCICAEVKMHIRHSFLSKEDNISAIEKLYTHQQTYSQCSEWIEQYQWEINMVESNALAAQLASNTPKAAAIASPLAAKEYELNELGKDIQNQQNNTTRFLIIGNHPVESSGNDNTTLVFSLKNEAGALQKALQILADKRINMSQILSRPNRASQWEYLFLIDIQGHQKDHVVAEGIQQLQQHVSMLKVLGSYPISPNI